MKKAILFLLVSVGSLLGCGAGSQSGASGDQSSAVSSAASSLNSAAHSSASSRDSTPDSRYPNYNTNPLAPDASGMNRNAETLAQSMRLGWNLGNTLEAIGGETNWGNPKATPRLMAAVKNAGFDAVRIPASWDQYADPDTAKIDEAWLNRVKEVVQYSLDQDLEVLLNIHWDGGWLENNVTPNKQDAVNAKLRAFWQQIATHLREFDDRLMFAGANEPAVDTPEQMAVLASYHRTFVDAVRATGGRNAYRTLVVQGPVTDIEKTVELMQGLPSDTVSNRLMLEVHFYTPYQFTLMTEDADWGNQFFYWGLGYHSASDAAHNPTWGEEMTVDRLFETMRSEFVDRGVPVILGEYSAQRRSTQLQGDALELHLDARAHWHQYVTSSAIDNGLTPFYWDMGGLGNFASGIFNRTSGDVFDQRTLEALLDGASE